MTTELHRDYETRSAADLKKVGAHVYAEHPTTDVIVACFAFDDEEPFDWYPGQPVPARVVNYINSGGRVCGHNAAFEAAIDREIMGPRYGFPVPDPEQLDCTLARSAIQAIPQSLDGACMALGLPFRKDQEGHRLMLRMCKPRKVHDDGTIEWWTDPERIARLALYCRTDIRAERALGKALRPMTPEERKVWLLDWRMNNRGVLIDRAFVNAAEGFAIEAGKRLDASMRYVTGGAVKTASNIDALKEWARGQGVEFRVETKTRRNGEEYEAESADKEALEDLLANSDDLTPLARRAFEIRLDAGKTSVKKLVKFRACAGRDGRSRGNVQYHAAGPGRWAGRNIQLQNLPRRGLTDGLPREVVKLLRDGDGPWETALRDMQELELDSFEMVWGPALDVLSRMLRGAVIAAPGNKLLFADYSQVEARGCVWAAKQQDQVELFAKGGKIYETMAASIFGLTVEEVIEKHETKSDILLRFLGKETVLGCGYGMGPEAFARNCKKKGKVILPPGIAEQAVYGWRDQNPKVVNYWRELEDAAKAAIEHPGRVYTAGPFAFRTIGNWLQMRLPIGRVLWYRRPTIEPTTQDLEAWAESGADDGVPPRYRWKIHYWGVNSLTKRWQKESTWGGKILENGVQGMCRDFLAQAKLRLEAAGYPPILSVHDEAISEVPDDNRYTEAEYLRIMTEPQPWAAGFPLKAESGSGYRYAK